jgi:hypothetical protein
MRQIVELKRVVGYFTFAGILEERWGNDWREREEPTFVTTFERVSSSQKVSSRRSLILLGRPLGARSDGRKGT